MGAALGSCIGSCVGTATMTACCAACGCQCLASPRMTNLLYVVLIAVAATAGVSLRYGGVDLNIGFELGISGPSICIGNSTACDSAAVAFSICNGDNCQGYWAVYRITFTLSGVFLLMALATACRCECSTRLHRGFWFFKAALIACTLAGTIFAPNDLFAYYAWFARFIAPLFLLYQLLIFIDFGYSLNESLIAKDERMDNFCGLDNGGFKYHCAILCIALVIFGASFTSIGVLYARWNMSCPFNPLAITTTLLLGLVNTAVSISKLAEHGSVLCSALIFAYQTWLCYASLASLPERECNPLQADVEEGSDAHQFQLFVSIAVAGGSCGYFAYRMGSKAIGGNAMTGGASKAPGFSAAESAPPPTGHDDVTVHVRDDNSATSNNSTMEAVEPASYGNYYMRMLIISMYMAMLLTDWGVAAETTASASGVPYSVGYASAWLQLGANWLCGLLYLWTLIAPKLFPDRDFS